MVYLKVTRQRGAWYIEQGYWARSAQGKVGRWRGTRLGMGGRSVGALKKGVLPGMTCHFSWDPSQAQTPSLALTHYYLARTGLYHVFSVCENGKLAC